MLHCYLITRKTDGGEVDICYFDDERSAKHEVEMLTSPVLNPRMCDAIYTISRVLRDAVHVKVKPMQSYIFEGQGDKWVDMAKRAADVMGISLSEFNRRADQHKYHQTRTSRCDNIDPMWNLG